MYEKIVHLCCCIELGCAVQLTVADKERQHAILVPTSTRDSRGTVEKVYDKEIIMQ